MHFGSQPAVQELKIDAAEVKERLEANEPLTILDVRGKAAWDSSAEKIRGAIRVDPEKPLRQDPGWPQDRLTVVY